MVQGSVCWWRLVKVGARCCKLKQDGAGRCIFVQARSGWRLVQDDA